MLQNTSAKRYFYSLKTLADFKGKILENGLTGLHMNVNDMEVYFKLIGEFNAYNLLAVFAVAICLGEEKNKVLQIMSTLTGAEGRFDYIISENEKLVGITKEGPQFSEASEEIQKYIEEIKSAPLWQNHNFKFFI